MFAGLVTVDENNFLNPDFRTGINRILNNRQTVEGKKPFVKSFLLPEGFWLKVRLRAKYKLQVFLSCKTPIIHNVTQCPKSYHKKTIRQAKNNPCTTLKSKEFDFNRLP